MLFILRSTTRGKQPLLHLQPSLLQRLAALPSVEVEDRQLFAALCELRSLKSESELRLLQAAADLGSQAHDFVLRRARPGMREFELANLFALHCRLRGADFLLPYKPIVAAGKNAAILHYHPDDSEIRAGQLVLCDMGCAVSGYACDISRTFPANGVFSSEQRVAKAHQLIYDLVLRTADSAIGQVHPGASFADIQRRSFEVLSEGLRDLGILKGSAAELMEKKLYRYFMPHSLGHFLGLYVHDVGPVAEKDGRQSPQAVTQVAELKEGMVTTIEPGLYFIDSLLQKALDSPETAGNLDVERLQQFRGVGGVRIEDDVAVTSSGARVLTSGARTAAEVEAAMASGG